MHWLIVTQDQNNNIMYIFSLPFPCSPLLPKKKKEVILTLIKLITIHSETISTLRESDHDDTMRP